MIKKFALGCIFYNEIDFKWVLNLCVKFDSQFEKKKKKFLISL